MTDLAKDSLADIYTYIMNNAHLDKYFVVKDSSTLGGVSFVEIDVPTRQYVLSVVENLNDIYREKANFMLDVCLLNLLRKGKDLDVAKVTALDVHATTLMKTSLRIRYLVVLADFIRYCPHQLLLNINGVPATLPTLRLDDLLRYLFPVIKNVAIQVTQESILAQDLTKISAKYFVLTAEDLTRISVSERCKLTLDGLARITRQNKEIIVRNVTQISQKSHLAYYL